MMQTSLDSFITTECDLQDLLRAIGGREDWETFHRAAELYSAETGAVSAWYPDGYCDTRDLVLHDAKRSRGSRLAISMGDGGWRAEGRCKGFITIEASHSIAHMILVECCSLFTGEPYKSEQKRLNLHRRYFEILAEAEGMILTSWGEGVAA